MLLSLQLVFASLVKRDHGDNWRISSDARWKFDCDFDGKDLSHVRVRGEECSGQCGATNRCTHFAWTTWNGGTCWMKSGTPGKPIKARADAGPGAVCGTML